MEGRKEMTTVKYVLRRVLHAFATLFIVVCIVFVLLRWMPVEGYFNNFERMSDTAIQVSLQKQGLTEPVPVQIYQ